MALTDYRNAIAGIESAGSGDYSALGPVTGGDRAYGRYQVMGANIGPWTQEVLGRELTPEEFLANPQIQDAVFDAKFGGYVQQYGPEGAAQAWFAGPGSIGQPGAGNLTDVLGTSVNDYITRFSQGAGGEGSAPGQVPGLPTQRPVGPPAAPVQPPNLSPSVLQPAMASAAPEPSQASAAPIAISTQIQGMDRGQLGQFVRSNYGNLSAADRVALARSMVGNA